MIDGAEELVVLIGGGGHALVVAETAQAAGLRIAGFLDDDPNAPLARRLGIERLGPLGAWASVPSEARLVLAIGNLSIRSRVLAGVDAERVAPAIVHTSAVVSPSAVLGKGVCVGPAAVIQTCARVDDHAIINTGAIVEHECHVGFNSHVAPGAVLGGRTRVGNCSLVGLGSRVLPEIAIGARAIVGAGAVVIHHVSDGATVAGCPARPLRV